MMPLVAVVVVVRLRLRLLPLPRLVRGRLGQVHRSSKEPEPELSPAAPWPRFPLWAAAYCLVALAVVFWLRRAELPQVCGYTCSMFACSCFVGSVGWCLLRYAVLNSRLWTCVWDLDPHCAHRGTRASDVWR